MDSSSPWTKAWIREDGQSTGWSIWGIKSLNLTVCARGSLICSKSQSSEGVQAWEARPSDTGHLEGGAYSSCPSATAVSVRFLCSVLARCTVKVVLSSRGVVTAPRCGSGTLVEMQMDLFESTRLAVEDLSGRSRHPAVRGCTGPWLASHWLYTFQPSYRIQKLDHRNLLVVLKWLTRPWFPWFMDNQTL